MIIHPFLCVSCLTWCLVGWVCLKVCHSSIDYCTFTLDETHTCVQYKRCTREIVTLWTCKIARPPFKLRTVSSCVLGVITIASILVTVLPLIVCVCVRACVFACVRVCVRACVRVFVCSFVIGVYMFNLYYKCINQCRLYYYSSCFQIVSRM